MYTPRSTKLQFKIIFEEDPVPIASAQQHIYIIQIFINIFLRERSRKMCSKTQQIAQLTRNLGSMLQYTLNIVCAVIHYLFFYIENKYFYNFFLQNFSKIFSKTHQIAQILKNFSGEHAPEQYMLPPSLDTVTNS